MGMERALDGQRAENRDCGVLCHKQAIYTSHSQSSEHPGRGSAQIAGAGAQGGCDTLSLDRVPHSELTAAVLSAQRPHKTKPVSCPYRWGRGPHGPSPVKEPLAVVAGEETASASQAVGLFLPQWVQH